MLTPTSASIIVALASSAVAIVLAIGSIYERSYRRRQETLIQALEYLTGGSQKRSVGLALIEGLWFKGHPNHRAIIPALTNQAVYLLLETESKGRHQFHSWLRIMNLILRVPPEPFLRDFYIELVEALERRSESDNDSTKGLDMSASTACSWSMKV
ncbi:MAG TPA: hypothetical protein VMF56_11225, partial [Acidobacteriaceae bacterium]|nr:hypothetical protein [Acidobacteriaceae bacterium]